MMFSSVILTVFSMLNIIYTPDTVPASPGVYEVLVESLDENASTYIDVTVVGENYNTVLDTLITANDFELVFEESYKMSDIIRLADAKAWNKQTGDEYPIVSMEILEETDSYIVVNFKTVYDVEVSATGSFSTQDKQFFSNENSFNGVTTGISPDFINTFSSVNLVGIIIYSVVTYLFILLIILFVVEQRALRKAVVVRERLEK